MHLTQKKRIEVYPDSRVVVLRDDEKNQSVVITNNGNNYEQGKENSNPGGKYLLSSASSTKQNILIYALYGVVELQSQNYLLAVTKAEFAANITGRNVYMAAEFKFIGLGFKDNLEDEYAIGMFQKFFATKSFYFSADYDLTHPFSVSAARSFKIKKDEFDERFYYNSAFTSKLKELGLFNWIQPFICGLVEQKLMTISQKALSFILISRRDKSRAGMRFISRGADPSGNVSNFAETEQILSFDNDDSFEVYTYLQTRGSIPFIWKQTPSLKWSPKLAIESNSTKTKNAFENHMAKIKKAYKENYLINLIDKKGSQKLIGEKLSELVRGLSDPSVKYTWFDFHAECKNMQYHNLSRLVNEILESIQKYKYGQYRVYRASEEGEETKVTVQQTQNGVFRTNCMDCLDRTNVVQSVLARNILLSQLHSAGITQKPVGDPFEKLPKDLEDTFKEFWTDNGNRLSLLYSGTGALKVDFTRTGTRTHKGALEDGQKAVTRYFINNFYDTYNQNALDLLLGKIKFHDLNNISKKSPTMTLGVGFAMMVGPYYLSAILLNMFGKHFNWSFFLILILLSAYMSYSYVSDASKKLWGDQVLRD